MILNLYMLAINNINNVTKMINTYINMELILGFNIYLTND